MLSKDELVKLQEFMRRSFGSSDLKVVRASGEAADMVLGERRIGAITVDDEDGDRSFSLAMQVPVARPALEDYLRKLFGNDKLKISARLKKTDSVELNAGSDFIGVLSADDPKGSSFTLQMAILDYDLEDT